MSISSSARRATQHILLLCILWVCTDILRLTHPGSILSYSCYLPHLSKLPICTASQNSHRKAPAKHAEPCMTPSSGVVLPCHPPNITSTRIQLSEVVDSFSQTPLRNYHPLMDALAEGSRAMRNMSTHLQALYSKLDSICTRYALFVVLKIHVTH